MRKLIPCSKIQRNYGGQWSLIYFYIKTMIIQWWRGIHLFLFQNKRTKTIIPFIVRRYTKRISLSWREHQLSLSLFSEENKFINGWNHRIINKEIYCEGNDNDPNYEKNRSIQRKCYFMTINVNLWPNFRESSDAIIIFNAGTNTTHNNKCHRIPDRYLQIKICGDVLFTFNRVNDRK